MINYWIKVKATNGNEDKAVRLILNFPELKKVAGDLSVSFNLPSSEKLSLHLLFIYGQTLLPQVLSARETY